MMSDQPDPRPQTDASDQPTSTPETTPEPPPNPTEQPAPEASPPQQEAAPAPAVDASKPVEAGADQAGAASGASADAANEPASPPTSSPEPTPESAPVPSVPDSVDREVRSAMAEMDPSDLAELTGGALTSDMPAPGPSDSVEPGTPLTGMICGVTADDVFLEFGVKSQGVMPRNQFGKKEPLENGRRVDVVVERFDKEASLLIVSRKGEAARATWATLRPEQIVEGRVTGMNKGGLEVDLHGIRAFLPASQVDLSPLKDISVLLNEPIKAMVLEVDRRSKNVLISRRRVLEMERDQAREKLREELSEGDIRKGVVRNITDFGAFVDLGGMDGLVHIRDISYGQVEKVTDVLSVGQEVEVKVLKLNQDRSRISLGMKQVQPDPWSIVPDKYPVGTELKVRIVRLLDFGAFAELETGIEGLIPVSEMAWSRVRTPADVVSQGDTVEAVIIRVEPKQRRLALSIKQATPDPWAGVLDDYKADEIVQGRVTRVADFGAFVELKPGVEGMIHISEMSEKRINKCTDVVQPEQEVEARILGVDAENHRISLSLKPATAAPSPGEHTAAGEPAKPKKKRKKPLRGGLAAGFDFANFDLGNLPDLPKED